MLQVNARSLSYTTFKVLTLVWKNVSCGGRRCQTHFCKYSNGISDVAMYTYHHHYHRVKLTEYRTIEVYLRHRYICIRSNWQWIGAGSVSGSLDAQAMTSHFLKKKLALIFDNLRREYKSLESHNCNNSYGYFWIISSRELSCFIYTPSLSNLNFIAPQF